MKTKSIVLGALLLSSLFTIEAGKNGKKKKHPAGAAQARAAQAEVPSVEGPKVRIGDILQEKSLNTDVVKIMKTHIPADTRMTREELEFYLNKFKTSTNKEQKTIKDILRIFNSLV